MKAPAVTAVVGKRVRVVREVTALRPTREWTGVRIWDGVVTDATTAWSDSVHGAPRPVAEGELTGVCVRTEREHTWLSLAAEVNGGRHWVTRLELV